MGLWTREHLITILPTFAIMIVIAFLMRRLLIKKRYEIRMIPIKIIAVILILMEIGKQWCSIMRGYDLYHIPLHFCSIFLYILPLFAFYRGKWRQSVGATACTTMMALFIGMLVLPNAIYTSARFATFFTDYFSFHTVVFHNLVIFVLFLTLALDLHSPSVERRELIFLTVFGVTFVALSACAAHLLDTNYSNFLESSIGFVAELVSRLGLAIGEIPTKILYGAVLGALHILLLIVTYYLFFALCKAMKTRRS